MTAPRLLRRRRRKGGRIARPQLPSATAVPDLKSIRASLFQTNRCLQRTTTHCGAIHQATTATLAGLAGGRYLPPQEESCTSSTAPKSRRYR